ncbi:MAG: hypothetical protein C0465_25260 [Ralstonia sp.]|uniref:hypothetical protein n=1 Tax=Ralstonia sp. TaxID=54061 RepID=UPI00257E241D|nr:hypothetical protein [Ralstonia sp.]MBA4233884.1 hypothetical protein [Ralstonia sp.]
MMPDERPLPKTDKPRILLSVPLTAEQKTELLQRAGRQPLSAYARDRLFAANDNAPVKNRKTRHSAAVKDHKALAEILARLGKSDQASSLTELSRLARLGALPVTPETEAALLQASADIAAIKSLLMKALGVRER